MLPRLAMPWVGAGASGKVREVAESAVGRVVDVWGRCELRGAAVVRDCVDEGLGVGVTARVCEGRIVVLSDWDGGETVGALGGASSEGVGEGRGGGLGGGEEVGAWSTDVLD